MASLGRTTKAKVSLDTSGTPFAGFFEKGSFGKPKKMPMNTNSVLDEERDREVFESVTDEEIIYLWRSIKGCGISGNEAWNAVMAGLALDMAFAKGKPSMQIENTRQ
jgi:hypothetical protein